MFAREGRYCRRDKSYGAILRDAVSRPIESPRGYLAESPPASAATTTLYVLLLALPSLSLELCRRIYAFLFGDFFFFFFKVNASAIVPRFYRARVEGFIQGTHFNGNAEEKLYFFVSLWNIKLCIF